MKKKEVVKKVKSVVAKPKKSVAKKELTKTLKAMKKGEKIEVVAYVPKCLTLDNIEEHLYVSTKNGSKLGGEWYGEEWPPRKAKVTIEFLD